MAMPASKASERRLLQRMKLLKLLLRLRLQNSGWLDAKGNTTE